ncbi:AN1-type domain-containing protein [Plasmodiophora brassicae]
MDFANAGGRCGRCARQDFLPVPCAVCDGVFCAEHSASHGCVLPQRPVTSVASATCPSPQCVVCKSSPNVVVTCPMCSSSLCVAHRNADDHPCKVSVQPVRVAGRGRALIEAARAKLNGGRTPEHAAAPVQNQPRRAPSAKKQAMLNKMKVKLKARGNDSVPAEHRLYVYADLAAVGASTIPVWIDRRKTIGHALDVICDLGRVRNENHIAGARQLRLTVARDLPVEPLPTDIPINDMTDEGLVDGDTLTVVVVNLPA